MKRTLKLRKETLAELSPEQLRAVAGGRFMDTVGEVSLITCTCGCDSNGCCSVQCSDGGVCCVTYTCPSVDLTRLTATFGL